MIPFSVLKDVIEEFEADTIEWAPAESASDYDEAWIKDVSNDDAFYTNFLLAIENVKKLASIELSYNIQSLQIQLLYANVITVLETYLSDAFIYHVMTRKSLVQKFVESNPSYQKTKIPKSSIFEYMSNIEEECRSFLSDIVWHNLSKVNEMYKDVLSIDFIADADEILTAIQKRHDIVHRNGKSKDKIELNITQKDVFDLVDFVSAFVEELENQLQNSDKQIEESME